MNSMQRLVISNLFGFGFVALSWVAVILIYETSENLGSWSLPWLLGSLLLILLDVGYRYRGIRWKQRQADQADGASSRSEEPLAHAYKRCVTNRFPRVDTGNRVSDGLCGAERS